MLPTAPQYHQLSASYVNLLYDLLHQVKVWEHIIHTRNTVGFKPTEGSRGTPLAQPSWSSTRPLMDTRHLSLSIQLGLTLRPVIVLSEQS